MLRKLVLSNYRSLGERVEVPLGQMTALVGPNASGKSAIIDALRFVSEALRDGLPDALQRRGGLPSLRRAGVNEPITIRIEFAYPQGNGSWEFSLAGGTDGLYQIEHNRTRWRPDLAAYARHFENLLAKDPDEPSLRRELKAFKQGDEGSLTGWGLGSYDSNQIVKEAPSDLRLKINTEKELVDLSIPAPLGVSDKWDWWLRQDFRGFAAYILFPEPLRPPQKPDVIKRPMMEKGENWASVLRRIKKSDAGQELIAGLGRVVGDITDYRVNQVGGYLAVQFKHGDTWLDAAQESDGTLRVAGLLTALLQDPPLKICAIEEPELTVHPGALPLLYDFIKDSSQRTQMVLSTHSPDLIDLLDVDSLLLVERRGTTVVSAIDPAQRALVKEHLLRPSEIMRTEGLRPEPSAGTGGSGT